MEMGWSFWTWSWRAIEEAMVGGTLYQSSVWWDLPLRLIVFGAAACQEHFFVFWKLCLPEDEELYRH